MKKIALLLVTTVISFSIRSQPKIINIGNTIAIDESDSKETIIQKAAHVVPTSNQLSALKNEFIAFIHFGPNSFTKMEWGNGMEDPKIFDLRELHTDQWCAAMKAAGMKMVIITVKHHDGFVLWQSRYTAHGIMSTNFRNGKGDILKDLSASCKKYGLKLGIYLSPADLFQIESPTGLYGNLSKTTKRTIPRAVPGKPFKNKTTFQFEVDDYNEYFLNQLFELLTEYGPVHEVWFDGAHPKTKGGQQYNYSAWKILIHTLAPKAVIFGKEDIRWCGNESGKTRATEWNIIPYLENPALMNNFGDLTAETLGERDDLYKGKYLHYQQAETNTSIREGWFYRDDTRQKVRSADDVFDIYERSVGGNSTFLLNIPPNRDGKFSPADSAALYETGKRIKATYGTNLFKNATGPQQVLDENPDTYLLLKKNERSEIIISTPVAVTINRIVLQEAIGTHSERVEQHAVDAWINNGWKEIAASTNIGYKRILRFPEVKAQKFRLRILSARLDPAISTISAHYYKTQPPQLGIARDRNGLVTIAPLQQEFNWKPHGENALKNLNTGNEIYYSIDGSEPGINSIKYEGSFKFEKGEIKAVSITHKLKGAISSQVFGIIKKDWKLLEASSETKDHSASLVFDADPATYWQTKDSAAQFIAIDLGAEYRLKGFAYTPQKQHREGMMAKGIFQISSDGKTWQTVDQFEFGNLVNDPSTRNHYFKREAATRYIRIEATEIAANGKSLTIAELDFFD